MKLIFTPITRVARNPFACSVYTGIILLVTSGALAQNLFVDTEENKIYEFTPGGVQSTFFSGGVSQPQGLAFNSAGNLFQANGSTIYEFTPDGTRSTFASLAGVHNFYGLAFDSAGDLFVSDDPFNTTYGSIYEYTPGGARSTFATFINGGAEGMAFNSAGNLFVANGSAIYEYTPGGVQSTFAQHAPSTGLAFNSAGDLFVSSGNIYEYTPDGVRSTFAKNGVAVGLAFDSAGNLFAGSLTHNIYEYTPDGVQSIFSSAVTLSTWIAIQGVTLPVPEPSALGLLAVSFTALLIRRQFNCQRNRQ